MQTKDIVTAALVFGACLVIGDKPWTILVAAIMILAAGAIQAKKRKSP